MKGNFKCCWKRRLFETCPISTPWSRKNRLGKCNLWQLTTTCRNRHILKGIVSFGEAVSYNSFLIITGDGFCTYIVLKLSNHPFEISGIEKDTFTNILRNPNMHCQQDFCCRNPDQGMSTLLTRFSQIWVIQVQQIVHVLYTCFTFLSMWSDFFGATLSNNHIMFRKKLFSGWTCNNYYFFCLYLGLEWHFPQYFIN